MASPPPPPIINEQQQQQPEEGANLSKMSPTESLLLPVNANASASTIPVDGEGDKTTPPLTSDESDDKEHGDNEGGNVEGAGGNKRKRDFNRRKSDPVSLKKIKRSQEQEDSEEEEFAQNYDKMLSNCSNLLEEEDFDESFEDEDDDNNGDPDFQLKYKAKPVRPRSKVKGEERSRKNSTPREKSLPEMFHLSWKNHQSQLLQAFETLLEKETFCDVTLICDGEGETIVRIKAHKIVLSACSEYFRTILCDNPCKHPVIVLKDYSAWEMHTLLDFMYRGEVDVGVGKLKALVKTAESLQIRGLPQSLSSKEVEDGGVEEGERDEGDDVEELERIKSNNNLTKGPLGGEYDLGALNLSLEGGNKGEEELGRYETEEILRSQHFQIQQGLGLIMPRRKQARPRRRSGDYVAQDLRRKLSPSDSPLALALDNEDYHPNDDLDGEGDPAETEYFDDVDLPPEDDLSLPLPPLMNNLNKLLSRRLNSHPHPPEELLGLEEDLEEEEEEMGGRGGRRKSSRKMKNDLPVGGGGGGDEELIVKRRSGSDEVLDYTTTGGGVLSNKGKDRERRNVLKGINMLQNNNDNLQQQHLAFLRNYNWAMAHQQQHNQGHSHGHRGKMGKHDIDYEDGDHNPTPTPNSHTHLSPPLSLSKRGGGGSPSLKHGYHRHHHPSPQDLPAFPFLAGLHGNDINPTNNSNNAHGQSNKMSPQSPGPGGLNFFLGPSSSMSITPLGLGSGGGGEDSSSQSPHHVYSPMGLNLNLGEDRKKDERGGGGARGSPVQGQNPGWPAGLPLGPPPIFGRHRAQHSAPRGGPPRAWSNADLTEALHNVWNKKMTTSQASRIFGIPYNSLLMYVRGKYGKSLKLDLLKKGLDQALENTQNKLNASRANTPSSPPQNPTNTTPPTNQNSHSTPTNSNHHSHRERRDRGATTSPSSSSSVNAVTALLNSLHHQNPQNHNNNHTNNAKGQNPSLNPTNEHNNNNHQNNSNKSANSSKSHGHGGGSGGMAELMPQPLPQLPHTPTQEQHLPPGFNPFLFGDFAQANPFPFASALQHILPPHFASMAAHHPMLGGGGGSGVGSQGGGGGSSASIFGGGHGGMKVEKVGVGGDDEK